jgi:hypothetical protein
MIKPIEITSAGGTITLDTSLGYSAFLLYTSAPVALLASVNVVTNPNPIQQVKPIPIFYNGDINLSGNTFTIVGSNVNQGLCKKEFKVDLVSDGTNVTAVFDANDVEQPASVLGTNGLAAATSGTVSFEAGIDKNFIRIAGTTSASGNIVYQATGTPTDNDWFLLLWNAQLTLGANNLTIFGQSVTAAEALGANFAVFTFYDLANTAWRSFKISGTAGLAGLGNLPARTLIANPTAASAAATTIAANKNGQVSIMEGGTLKFSTLIAESFDVAPLFAPQYATITIPQAQVLTSGVTPVSLVSAIPTPDVGFYVHVIDINLKKQSATGYATNTDFAVRHIGAANPIRRKSGILAQAQNKYILQQIGGTLTGSQVLPAVSLEAYTETGDPTGTGGDIVLEIFYTIKPY